MWQVLAILVTVTYPNSISRLIAVMHQWALKAIEYLTWYLIVRSVPENSVWIWSGPFREIVGPLLIALTHAAIQVVYCHYMLTPSMECLWYVKLWHLCFKQEDQSIEWMTKGQAMALRVNVLRNKGFVFRQQSPILWEKTGPLHLALVGLTAGWQTKYGWISKFWKSSTG